MKNLLKASLIASLLWMAPLEPGAAQTSDDPIFSNDFESSPRLPGSLGVPGVVKDPKQSDRAFSWKAFENTQSLLQPPSITIPKGEYRFEADILGKALTAVPELSGYLKEYGIDIEKYLTDDWEQMGFNFRTDREISVRLDGFLRDTLGFANLLDGSSDVLFDNLNLQTLLGDTNGAQFQAITQPKPKPLSYIRIGDFDGFGFGEGEGLKAANRGPVNVDGKGLLASGDLLPDRNGDGLVGVKSKDNFDNRSNEERGNEFVTSNGFINVASVGSLFTDVSLSTSYKAPGDKIWTADMAKFVFNFLVDRDNIDPSKPVFFNLIFGDYDVKPASIKIIGANGVTTESSLTVQNNRSGENGLIQSAFSQLEFEDVFVDYGETQYKGNLAVEFKAKNEPYMAFDFVELSTAKIGTAPETVPEPSTVLGGLAFGAFVTRMRRRRKQQNIAK